VADSRIDELRRRIERDPGSRLFAQLAEEHRKAGELPEAIRVARAGLATHPVYASARLTLGRALLDSGDAAAARQELELALRQAPDNILASRFLGQTLEQLGDLEGALRQYTATLKMAPADQPLAAQVEDVAKRLEAARSKPALPTGPLPRAVPPPLPAVVAAAGSPSAGPLAPTLRLPGSPSAPVALPPAVPAPAVPAPATEARPAPKEIGSVTLPAPAPRPEAPAPIGPDASDAGQGAAPFSSSTLAELYLRQGLQERAAEVFRQVLAEDPRNERARAGLASLEGHGAGSGAPAAPAGGAGRREVLQRQIAGLEAMLGSVRRR
jgi:tetratricopeptide (TPR) repeat protein